MDKKLVLNINGVEYETTSAIIKTQSVMSYLANPAFYHIDNDGDFSLNRDQSEYYIQRNDIFIELLKNILSHEITQSDFSKLKSEFDSVNDVELVFYNGEKIGYLNLSSEKPIVVEYNLLNTNPSL